LLVYNGLIVRKKSLTYNHKNKKYNKWGGINKKYNLGGYINT